MNVVYSTLHKHVGFLRSYPAAFLIVLFCFGVVIYYEGSMHRLLYGCGYVFAVWFGAFVTDMVVTLFPKKNNDFPIKKPVWQELATIIVCTSLGIVFLIVRFHGNWDTMNHWLKLAYLPLILFTMPIVLAAIYLFRFKYKLSELGGNIRYWYLAIFIHIIVGCITLWAAPDKSHWTDALKEMSIMSLIFTGLISAALPEEFLRMLLQTRLGRTFKDMGLGLVVTSFIWCAMHLPVESQGEKTFDWSLHAIRILTLMPIGFLWGYIIHRTRSLLPSVLIHGFNLWGLQNAV
jgi:membrane protease YdiL (CAAX protease family)